ncbi:SulP family inorganic anion transporter, partial [Staphylococcus aureus]|uniref:SulP family inorganic anion transporter n=1 Tax=Staphylococcus aureus TaxID=1280 RepID=UPI00301E50D5
LLGVAAGGYAATGLLTSLLGNLGATHWPTLAVGAGTQLFLVGVRRRGKAALMRLGLADATAGLIARSGPVLAVVATTLASWHLDLAARGVAVVGAVPAGLPPLTLPAPDLELWRALLVPALLISVV